MIIRELYIKNFGKLSEKRIVFPEGICVISGENEYGKTTIHAFIRAMLFGMERKRGRAAAKDDFTRYEPWDAPGHYAGEMRFSCGGRNFCLTRTFDRFTKKTSLVCEDDGEELSVEQGDLDMLLCGLTPELFDSTVSVAQLRAEPGKELAEALENYAVNYFDTGGGEFDLTMAFRILKERKNETVRALKAEERIQDEKKGGLELECSYLEREMESLRNEYEEKAALAGSGGQSGCSGNSRSGKEEGLAEAGDEKEEGALSARSLFFTGLGGLAAGAAGFVWGHFIGESVRSGAAFPVKLIAAAAFLIGLFLCAASFYMKKKQKPRKIPQDPDRQLKWELDRIRSEWKEKKIRFENLREQCGEFEKTSSVLALEERCRAIELAQNELENAARCTGERTAQLVGNAASDILQAVTGGRYGRLEYDKNGGISVWDGKRRIPAERLSRGTLDQIYFALRMAAAAVILEEPMPVILDDTFAFYDDKRLCSALKWLSSQEKQVIIFTCHSREEEILEKEVFS